jgi:hypothetical protein
MLIKVSKHNYPEQNFAASLGLARREHFAIRVARWFVFKPKIPILGKFWRALDREMLIYFYGHLEYLTDIWDIL